MSHKYVLLKEVCEKASSNIAQKDLAECDGIYPIYGASGYIKSVDFFQQAKDYIAIVKDGAGIGRAMKLPAKSSVIGTMQYILPNDNINISYLYYAICSMHLEKYFSGATIPHIYFRDYQNEQLPLPTLEEQAKIANVFGRIDYFIKKEKEQLINLDELVKSRFIEMFGRELNRNLLLKETCIKGPQNGFYKKDAEINGTIPIIKMKQLFANDTVSEARDCDKVSLTKKELMNFKLTSSDLLFGRRSLVVEGAGKCRRVGHMDKDMIFESSLLRITLNEELLIPRFLQIWFETEEGKSSISSIRSVTTIAGIKGSDLAKIKVPTPPISLQESFLDFVAQVDKSKFVVTAKFQ